MAIDQVENFVRGRLRQGVDSSQTTFFVEDSTQYPDPANGEYNLVVWDDDTYLRPDQDPDVEIVRVTDRDDNNNELVVSRGAEGTTGAVHPDTSPLHLSPTEKVFNTIDTNIDDLQLNKWDDDNVLAGTDIDITGSGTDRTISHSDTSAQGNVSASLGGAVTDVDVDGRGHITSLTTGVLSHGNLDGLLDDDHPQYILADGTRAFSNPVEGVSPQNSSELTTKGYVDGVAQGLNLKDSVDASPTGNIDLASATDPNPVDGITLANGDRVLLKEQTDQTENGIYVANTATDPTTWTRSEDANSDTDVTSGLFTFVEEGVSNGNSSFIVTTEDPITVGTTAIQFAQFSSAGEIQAGDGLGKSGQTLSVDSSDLTGEFLSTDGSNNLRANIGRGLESDGSDSIQFDEDTDYTFTVTQTFDAGLDTQGDITDGTQNIWDATSQEIPDSALGSIDNATLTNNSVTINANDGLKSGGTVSLGGSVGLDIEPAEFAGSFLSDDGSDNLQVNIGRGLESDAGDSIRFDEDTSYTFTTAQTFSAGLDTNGDITDGSTLIYDSSLSQVEQDTLENDSITVNANDGLVGGGAVALGSSVGLDVEPNDFAGTYLQDDGSDNLEVLIGRGLENDGSGNIQFDEDTAYTFTTTQTFSNGLITDAEITLPSIDGRFLNSSFGYDFYTESTGDGSDNSRVWFDSPDGGQIIFGPRSGGETSIIDFVRSDVSIDGPLSVNEDVNFGGNLFLTGNTLQQVGGTNDASSGAIRLSNDTEINTRNNSNSADIGLIRTTADQIQIGWNRNNSEIGLFGNNNVRIDGQNLTEVGGTTDARSGAIRLANDSPIAWRNSVDTANASLVYANSDDFQFSTASTNNALTITNTGNVSVPNGDLRVDYTSGIRGFQFEGDNGTIRFDNDRMRHYAGGTGTHVLDLNDTGDVDVLSGNLNVNNGELYIKSTSVANFTNSTSRIRFGDGSSGDILRFQEGGLNTILKLNQGGNVNIPDGKLFVSGFEISEFSDLGADNRYFNLRTYGTGDGAVQIQDRSNSDQDILVANEGGNVEIPSGSLSVANNIDLTGGRIDNVGQINADSGAGAPDAQILFGSAYNQIKTGGAQWEFYDSTNAQPIVQFEEGGAVDILNGNLTVSTGNLDFTAGKIERSTSSTDSFDIFSDTSSDNSIALRSGVDSNVLFEATNAGNVEIPNGTLTVGGDTLAVEGDTGQTIELGDSIPEGNSSKVLRATEASYDYNGLAIETPDENGVQTQRIKITTGQSDTGNDESKIEFTRNDTYRFSDGNVEIQDGNLDISGNNIENFESIIAEDAFATIQTDGSGSGSVVLYDNSNRREILDASEGGDVEIPNGDLALFNNVLSFSGQSYEIDFGIDNSAANGIMEFKDDSNSTRDGRVVYYPNSSGTESVELRDSTDSNILEADLSGTGNINVRVGNVNILNGGVNTENALYGANEIEFYGLGSRQFRYFENNTDLRFAHQYSKATNEYRFSASDGSGNLVRTIAMPSGGSNAGNVEIPNGELIITATASDLLTLDVDSTQTGYNAKFISYFNDGDNPTTRSAYVGFGGNGTTFNLRNETGGSVQIGTEAFGNSVEIFDSGDVEIPNGDLRMGGNSIRNISSLFARPEGYGSISFGTAYNQLSTGGSKWQIDDTTNELAVAKFEEGGNVEIPNGDLTLGDNQIIHNGPNNPDAFTRWEGSSYIVGLFGGTGYASQTLQLGREDNDGTTRLPFGNVEIPNGKLQVSRGGPNGTGEVEFGQGSRLYENASGEIVAEDSNGNTTTLT